MVCNEVVVDSNGKGGEKINVNDHRLYQPITTRFEQNSALNGSVESRGGEMRKKEGIGMWAMK